MMNTAWQPSASVHMLQQRAKLLAAIRHYFAEHNVLEIQAPVLSASGNPDPNLNHFVTRFRQQSLQLQTSPEFHMKRCLAAGSGSIYALGPAFRDDELGRYHNPEFTMLEWYRVGYDHRQLMEDVWQLLQSVGDFAPVQTFRYQALFQDICELDPADTNIAECAAALKAHGVQLNSQLTELTEALQCIMSLVIEPQLPKGPVFVVEFPKDQAMLAKLTADGMWAERFELYIDGVEIANGFHELTDPIEQRRRLEHDSNGAFPIDDRFLAALEHGLPNCAGVALGVDRLLMSLTQCAKLADTMAFAIDIS